MITQQVYRLVGVRDASHATHHAEDVVVDSIDADLGRVGSRNRARRKDKLEDSIVNAREVARPAWLMLFGAEGKGVHVDARIGGARVVLEGLDNVEVRAFTLREAVLAVKLEFGSDDGVLAPAVHIEGRLRKNEGTGIRNVRARDGGLARGEGEGNARGIQGGKTGVRAISPLLIKISDGSGVNRASLLEKAAGGDEPVGAGRLGGASESVDSVGEGVNGVRVVEGLGAERAVKGLATI